MTVQEKIKKIKDTERILKAITLCEEDLFETVELEELTDEYVYLDSDYQYGEYEAYDHEGKVVFAKPLNEENDFGKVVIIPHDVTEEEYEIISNESTKSSNGLANLLLVTGITVLSVLALFLVVTIIQTIRNGAFTFMGFLQLLVLYAVTPVLLSVIAFAVSKMLRK